MDSYCYPQNTWFTVALAIDLDTRTASLTVNDSTLGPWNFDTMPNGSPSQNILGSLRLTSGSGIDVGIGQYYMDDIVFQAGTVGIHEQQLAHIQPLQITPNPSSSATTLSTSAPVHKGTLTIHDASGRIALQGTWPAGSDKYILPTGALAPGTYVVRVAAGAAARDPAGGYVGRLVVMP